MAMIKKQFNNKKQNFQRKKGGDFKKKPFGKRFERGPVVQAAENFKNFEGVFKQSGKKNTIMTKNLTPGLSVYDEKRVSFGEGEERTEYRIWNPFRSKLGAGIVAGCNKIAIRPGSKVLYLGAASGTTVSHVSDIVGENGTVFAVEFSQRSGRDLVTLAQKRRNIIPIIEDARQPSKYRMLVQMCDVIFSDVAQPDQVRIVGLNAKYFLKAGGIVMISIKANCVDSTKAPQAVFAQEVNNCKKENITPKEQVSLEPFEKDHAMIVGSFSPN